MSLPRYAMDQGMSFDAEMIGYDEGEYVLFTDHERDVAAAHALALDDAVDVVTSSCIASGHHDASPVHWESDYRLCEDCKGVVDLVARIKDAPRAVRPGA